jgi:hypothetical protein
MTHLTVIPIKQYREQYGLTLFVETGCQEGEGMTFANQCGFDEHFLFSCDIRQEAVDATHQLLPGSFIMNSDSLTFLETILPQIPGPTLFWLDAHFPAFYAVKETSETRWPLFAELELIKTLKPNIEKDVIICDDMRMLISPRNPNYTLDEVPENRVQYIDVDWEEFTQTFSATHTAQSIKTDTGILVFLPKGAV